MREESAAEVMKTCMVYRLYGDNTESLVTDAERLKSHAEKGGILGVEKSEWLGQLELENPLKAGGCPRRTITA